MKLNCSQKSRLKFAGFTLVELMVTVAIMAIIAGLTFGNMNTASYKLKTTAKILSGNMQRARLEAVKRNVDVSVGFDRDGDGTLDQGYYNLTDASGNQILAVNDNKVTFIPSMISITFTPQGTCSAANIKMVTNGTTKPEYKVTTNNIGRVKFEKTQ